MSLFYDNRGFQEESYQTNLVFFPCKSNPDSQQGECYNDDEISELLEEYKIYLAVYSVTKSVDMGAKEQYLRQKIDWIDLVEWAGPEDSGSKIYVLQVN